MKIKWQWIWLLWLIVVMVLSLMPPSSLPSSSALKIPYLDKIVHLTMYMILSYTMLRFFVQAKISHKLLYVLIFCILLGIGIELLQSTKFISRSFEFADIIANIIGALIGVVIFKFT